ncbi:MAG: ECF transporter S component [Microbacteriaceae bacterium]|nr:MAG: ECF transporter S component [Microbacteriaceae bacterium]
MSRFTAYVKRDFSLIALLLIPVCIAINIVGFQLTQVLRLPIFLDSIGTILAGAVAGPWVGAVVGLLTNCINGIFNPVYFPFALTSIGVGIAAGLLARKGMFAKIWKLIIASVVIVLVSTIISGIISVFVFGGATGGTGSIFTAALLAAGNNIMTSVFSVQIFSELGDKILSCFIAYFIIKGMPATYLSKMKYGAFYMSSKKKSRVRTA